MWRLGLRRGTGRQSERGAISVILALMMVSLLGFTAIAVDVGMMYAERTQLRNGADAAALAVAQKCSKNAADPECSTTSPLARSLANSNAGDGLSNIKSTVLDMPNRTVTVTAGAQEAGKTPNEVSLFFARALGFNTVEVTAGSTVRWGSPVAGTTPFPLTVSVCQVSGMVDGGVQLIQNHSANGNPDCPLGPPGYTVPGGFAWIVQDPGVCSGSVDIDINKSGSETGNDGPSNCNTILNHWADELTASRPVIIFLPVYDHVTGTGSGASYHLIAFAALSVMGWKFASGNGTNAALIFHNTKNDVGNALACTGDCRGVIGSFVKYVSLSDGYRLGPVNTYGATVVEFSN